MFNLKNKYCLVTGCNGYVGRVITKKLKLLGARIIGTDSEIDWFIKKKISKNWHFD